MDSAGNIQVGDLVVLKSGGPTMTVEKLGGASALGIVDVLCVWTNAPTDKTASYNEHTFKLTSLKYVPESKA
jgi:uncharacterized protein YodC (DUF2158 family)